MGPAGRAQITFAFAAKAAAITEKQLRNWLDKAQVSLQGDDERSGGQWRRFSLIDVVRLGVIGAIVRYGIPVTQAADILGATLDARLQLFGDRIIIARRAIDAATRGAVLVISKDAEELDFRFGFDQAKEPSRDPYGFKPAGEPDTSDLQHFVLVDVGQIAGEVLTRLDEENVAEDDE